MKLVIIFIMDSSVGYFLDKLGEQIQETGKNSVTITQSDNSRHSCRPASTPKCKTELELSS